MIQLYCEEEEHLFTTYDPTSLTKKKFVSQHVYHYLPSHQTSYQPTNLPTTISTDT